MVRGDEALPAFDVAPDYESYEFTKLDPSKKEDKVCFVRPSSSIVLNFFRNMSRTSGAGTSPLSSMERSILGLTAKSSSSRLDLKMSLQED